MSTDGQYTRRVTLPSGRVITVIYYEPRPDLEDLSTCPACNSVKVYPADSTELENAATSEWLISRICPDCDWHAVGVHDQASYDAWVTIIVLDRNRLVTELNTMIRARMADDIDRFANALEHGHILPEDF